MKSLFTICTVVYFLVGVNFAEAKNVSVNKRVVKEVRLGLWYQGIEDKRAPGGGDSKSEGQISQEEMVVPEELVRAMIKVNF